MFEGYEERKSRAESAINGLIQSLQNVPPVLKESIIYSLSNGGKRIRPVLFYESYNVFGGKESKAADSLACAIECIHTYSLIHDDLPCMDNDDLRRGKPTNHKVFGEGMAVLAGDALLNLAYELCFDAVVLSGYDKNYVLAGKKISNLSGKDGLIAGQSLDISFTDANASKETIDYIYRHKTADLIKAAIYAGAVICGAEEAELKALEAFADSYGYAFQIRDDILDHNEKKENKIKSFVDIYGLQASKDYLEKMTEKAIESLKTIKKDTSFFQKFVKASIWRKV